MTRENNIAKLAQLKADAEALATTYNEAMLAAKFDVAKKADEDVDQVIGEYTSIVRTMCFEDCNAAEDPMMEAIKRLSFVTIRKVDTVNQETKISVRSIDTKEQTIDLLKLHKFCQKAAQDANGKHPDGIGHDKNWPAAAEKLNFLLTYQAAVDLGINPKTVSDSYAMSNIAREFDMGKTPTSNTNMLKTLQTVVTAMLGEGYKATSHDVEFLKKAHTKKSRKALTLACANHRNFRGYMAEICNHIAFGTAYGLDYKTKKDSVSTTPKPAKVEGKAPKTAPKAATKKAA